jgi:hypothetical protein
MRRFSVAEALLIVGSVVFVVAAFLVLELQRTHQLRMERLLAARAEAQKSPVQVIRPVPVVPPPQLAVTPEPPVVRRNHDRPRPPKPVRSLDLDSCEASPDPLCGMH